MNFTEILPRCSFLTIECDALNNLFITLFSINVQFWHNALVTYYLLEFRIVWFNVWQKYDANISFHHYISTFKQNNILFFKTLVRCDIHLKCWKEWVGNQVKLLLPVASIGRNTTSVLPAKYSWPLFFSFFLFIFFVISVRRFSPLLKISEIISQMFPFNFVGFAVVWR